ncbi:MAG: pitrilysin family protein [candidate division Zixibacteria bacterium]
MINKIFLSIVFLLLSCINVFAGDVKLPPITEKTLDNGLLVVVVENHELPIVYMKTVIVAGSLYDTKELGGLASFTADMIRKGTNTRTAVEIAESIDFVGGSLNSSASRDAIYVNTSVLVKHFDIALDLLSDIVLNPVFDEDEIERKRKKTLSEIIQSKERPSTVCANAFNDILFGVHPYGHPVIGTRESVGNIARDDIVNFYETYFRPNNSILLIAGDIEPNDAVARIADAFRGWQKAEIPDLSTTSFIVPEGHKILLIDKPDATQTYIRFGNFGITRGNDDYYSFLVMNYILGSGVSFVNRLMQQVRDDAGLTYDIRTVNEFHLLPGAYYCNTFTENDSTLKAINAAIGIMKDMAENDVSDDEYKNAVSFWSGFYPITLETPSQVANEIIKTEVYNLPESYIEDFAKNIKKVKKKDIRRIAKRLIDTDNMVFVVVSNAADVKDDLEKLGTVTVKHIDDF